MCRQVARPSGTDSHGLYRLHCLSNLTECSPTVLIGNLSPSLYIAVMAPFTGKSFTSLALHRVVTRLIPVLASRRPQVQGRQSQRCEREQALHHA